MSTLPDFKIADKVMLSIITKKDIMDLCIWTSLFISLYGPFYLRLLSTLKVKMLTFFQFLEGKKLEKQKKMSLNTERLVLQSLETKIPNQIDTLENHTGGEGGFL